MLEKLLLKPKKILQTAALTTFLSLPVNALAQRTFDQPIQVSDQVVKCINVSAHPTEQKIGVSYIEQFEDPYPTKTLSLKFAEVTNKVKNRATLFDDDTSDRYNPCILEYNPETKNPAVAHNKSFYLSDGRNWTEQTVVTTEPYDEILDLGFSSYAQPFILAANPNFPDNDLRYYYLNSGIGPWHSRFFAADGTSAAIDHGDNSEQYIAFIEAAPEPYFPFEVLFYPFSGGDQHITLSRNETYRSPLDLAHKTFTNPSDQSIENFPCLTFLDKDNISLYDLAPTVEYCEWDGSQWNQEQIDIGVIPMQAPLVVDKNNVPHVAYMKTQDNLTYDVILASKESSGWEKQVVKSFTLPQGRTDISFMADRHVSLALTKDDKIVLGYAPPRAIAFPDPVIRGGAYIIAEDGALPGPTLTNYWEGYR